MRNSLNVLSLITSLALVRLTGNITAQTEEMIPLQGHLNGFIESLVVATEVLHEEYRSIRKNYDNTFAIVESIKLEVEKT